MFYVHEVLSENRAVYEIMSKNMAKAETTDENTIWRIHFAFWLNKATRQKQF